MELGISPIVTSSLIMQVRYTPSIITWYQDCTVFVGGSVNLKVLPTELVHFLVFSMGSVRNSGLC